MSNGSGGVRAPRRPRKPKNRRGSSRNANPGGSSGGTSFDSQNPNDSGTLSFGNKKEVKGGVEARARKRFKAVDGVKGVKIKDGIKDGITGREARKIKRAWIREGRPSPGGSGGGGNAQQRNAGTPNDPFAAEVNALARLQFGGQERQLDSERRISDQHSMNMGGWYGNYVNTLQGAAREQQAFTQGLQQAQFQQANMAA